MLTLPSRQESRSEETRGAILRAAGELFAAHGYDDVTMRQIAQAAGCSHTTIYIYFKDKEALLHQLAMGPLEALRSRLIASLQDPALSPEGRLKRLSREFIDFCLANRTMYTIFFMAQAGPVDVEAPPTIAVQRLRIDLFGLLMQGVGACLDLTPADSQLLAYARVYFFTLHGIVGTYTGNGQGAPHGPLDVFMERMAPTFDLAVDVLLAGFKQTMKGS